MDACEYFIFLDIFVAAVLVAIGIVDLKTGIIPNLLVLPVAVAAAAKFVLLPSLAGALDCALGALLGGGALLLIALVGKWLLKRDAMGMGDVKLMTAAGLYLGFRLTLVALFIASVLGGVIAAALLLSKKLKREDEIVFGPMLGAGCITALFVGEALIGWYLH